MPRRCLCRAPKRPLCHRAPDAVARLPDDATPRARKSGTVARHPRPPADVTGGGRIPGDVAVRAARPLDRAPARRRSGTAARLPVTAEFPTAEPTTAGY